MRYPDRTTAISILEEGVSQNPGPWRGHSYTAADCAEKIARACGMNAEKAYVLGLLHDIGRRFGVTGMRHILDGYDYMLSLGFPDCARICLTHSFSVKNLLYMLGKWDLTEAETGRVRKLLEETEFDDYDKLIILCDSVSMSDGYADQLIRMADVKARYGRYPQEKWDANIALRKYFEDKSGKTLNYIMNRA